MKILLLALTVGAMAVAGCGTENARLQDPNSYKDKNYNDYGTNAYSPKAPDNSDATHYGPGGYSAVGPDGVSNPTINPLNGPSDNSILKK